MLSVAVSKSVCIRSKTEDLNCVKGQRVHASLSQLPNTWCNDRPIFLFSLEDTQLSSANPAKAVEFWKNWHDLFWFTVRGTTVGVHLDLKMHNTDFCAKKRQCLPFNADMLRLRALNSATRSSECFHGLSNSTKAAWETRPHCKYHCCQRCRTQTLIGAFRQAEV